MVIGLSAKIPYFSILLLTVGIPLQVVAAGAAVWALSKYPDITVLDDGLDVSGRFVPFSAVGTVSLVGAKRIKIEYQYHGARFTEWIGLPRIGSIDRDELGRELQIACGLHPQPRPQPAQSQHPTTEPAV